MHFYEKKWFLAAALIIPNLIVALILDRANPVFALGAGLGAATVVFLFYLICRTLLQQSRMARDWQAPLALVGAYAIYYAYIYLF